MAHLKKWTAVAAGGRSPQPRRCHRSRPGLCRRGALERRPQAFGRHGVTQRNPVQARQVQLLRQRSQRRHRSHSRRATHSPRAIDGDSGTWVQTSNTAGIGIHRRQSTQPAAASSPDMSTTPALESRLPPNRATGPARFRVVRDLLHREGQRRDGSQAHGNVFARADAVPANAGPIVPGTYLWTEDGYYSGNITIASGNTYTSTLSGNDSGAWVQAGSAVAFSISSGVDSGIGCLEVGKVNPPARRSEHPPSRATGPAPAPGRREPSSSAEHRTS